MPAWTSGVEDLLKRQAPMGPPVLTPEEIAYTNAPQILSITGSFFAAAALVVLLRCYVRISMLKVFGIDDYVMVLAMLLAAVNFALFKIETDHGLGKHFMVLLAKPEMYAKFAKLLYVHSIVIMVGISTVKVSIAFFLLRLSPKTSYSRFLYGIVIFIVFFTIVCAMTLIFQCLPVDAIWDMRLRPPPFGTGDARCYSMNVFRNLGLMNSSFNIVTDILFATIPIPMIWKLQLNIRTKISLILILSLGWFACAAAIIKAIQQWNVLNDPDWTVHDSFNVWNYIEFTIGIIAASLPALKPLFNWFLETARAFTSGARSKASGYGGSTYKGAGSLGYRKASEQWDQDIELHSVTSRSDTLPGSPSSPYRVKVSTQPMGIMDKEAWGMSAKNSQESILPLQYPERTQNGIMMTREVRVS